MTVLIAVCLLVCLRLITSSIPSGIQHNSESLQSLTARGCIPCYDEYYSHFTTTDDILRCKGPYLFVGARQTLNATFLLGAFGLATDVSSFSNVSPREPLMSNGVYWYLFPASAFGFHDRMPLELDKADISEPESDSRLSWHLDRRIGGYRAGSASRLYNSVDYKKAIYNCPHNARSAPVEIRSASPSTKPSSSPSVITAEAPTVAVSLTTIYPSGIQYSSESLRTLQTRGCTPCYDAYYLERTTSEEILQCDGPMIFVGAKASTGATFLLGAFGLATNVTAITHRDTPHLSNGVYWYRTPNTSFGFLDNTNLQQSPADKGTVNPHSRLSWTLDSSFYDVADADLGGYRAGENIDLGFSKGFKKIIFNCPLLSGSVTPPSAAAAADMPKLPKQSNPSKQLKSSKSSKSSFRQVKSPPHAHTPTTTVSSTHASTAAGSLIHTSLDAVKPAHPHTDTSVDVVTSYPFGIQYESVSLHALATLRCEPCYVSDFSHVTQNRDILDCIGPYLFVGERLTSSSTFTIGAFGLATDVTRVTGWWDTHIMSNGVYWVFSPHYQFGFVSTYGSVFSHLVTHRTIPDSRLTWAIDGVSSESCDTTDCIPRGDTYVKSIFSCPITPKATVLSSTEQ